MYTLEKESQIRLNGRLTNVYNVYQTEVKEKSRIIETCERPGVTVVTDRIKFIERNAEKNVKIFVGKAYGKTKKQAEEDFFYNLD